MKQKHERMAKKKERIIAWNNGKKTKQKIKVHVLKYEYFNSKKQTNHATKETCNTLSN